MYSLEQKTSSNHVTDKGCKWDSLNGSDSADKRSIWCSVLQKRLFFPCKLLNLLAVELTLLQALYPGY